MSMMNTLKISARLRLGFAGVLLILGILAAVAANRILAIGVTVDQVVTLGDEGTTTGLMRAAVNSQASLAKDLVLAASAEDLAGVGKKLDEEIAKYGKAERHLDELLAGHPPEHAQAALLDEARALGQPGAAAVEQLRHLAASSDKAALRSALPAALSAIQAWRARLNDLVKLQAGLNEIAAGEARQSVRGSLIIIGVVSLLGLLLGGVLATAIATSILRPLRAALAIARQVAEGRLDLSHPEVVGSDETAELLRALASMAATLRETVQTVAASASALAGAAAALGQEARDSDQGAERQAREVAGAAAAVEEMTQSMRHISSSATDVKVASQEVKDTARSSTDTMQRLGTAIGSVQHSVDEIEHAVEGFVGHTTEITGMTRQVRELAEQTNLLALNAAIEAARAGEMGRGFAVVADEVRKLAEHSAQAASRIDTVTRALEAQSGQVRQVVRRGREALVNSDECKDALARLLEGTQALVVRTHQGVEAIATSVAQQSVASNMLAASADQAAHAAQQQRAAAAQVRLAVHALEALAGDMQRGMAGFRL